MVTERGGGAMPTDRQVLLDACVAINLYATGRLLEIAQTTERTYLMVSEVAKETLYVEDVVEGELIRARVDLDPAISAGFLSVVALDNSEVPTFVDLAAQLDDGEAATMAVAQSRGQEMATDDRKARRVARERGLPEPTSTSDLLFDYATRLQLQDAVVGNLLLSVQQKARYRPRSADPRYYWWSAAVAAAS